MKQYQWKHSKGIRCHLCLGHHPFEINIQKSLSPERQANLDDFLEWWEAKKRKNNENSI